MFCPNCNSMQRDQAKFCDECGFPLTGAIARWTQEPSAQDSPTDKIPVDAEEKRGAHAVADIEAGLPTEAIDSEVPAEPADQAESVEDAPLGEPAGPVESADSAELAGLDETAGPGYSDRAEQAADFPKTPDKDVVAPTRSTERVLVSAYCADEIVYTAGTPANETMPLPDVGGVPAPTAETQRVGVSDVEIGPADEQLPGGQFDGRFSAEPQLEGGHHGGNGIEAAIDAGETVPIDVDFSGFDRPADLGERLVDPDYERPDVEWRDGGTMKMPRVEGDESSQGKEYLASSTKKKSNRPKIVAGVLTALVVIAAAVALGTYHMQLWGGVAVADVVGMTQADAESVLADQGFGVRAMQVKSDDTEGLVLVMDPGSGSRIEPGSEVLIHIATSRLIPDVVGSSEEDAAAAFAEEGYANVMYVKERSDEPEGTVLSVEPGVGVRAKSVQEIIVKVADPYTVPDVAGMSAEEAGEAIVSAGLRYDITYVDTTEYPDRQVISSDPSPDTKVKSGSLVMLQVARARGVELVDLTKSYLSPGYAVTMGFYNYEIVSLDSVEYVGNNTVSFVMTARPFTYILGEVVSISARQVSGEIVWSDNNTVVSIS